MAVMAVRTGPGRLRFEENPRTAPAPGKKMSLPRRQQEILDQMERLLHSGDPRLKSMFSAFHRSVQVEAMPASEVIVPRSPRRVMILSAVVLLVLGLLALCITITNNDCPGLPSDQVIATAQARYAGCSQSTDAWSRGAR